MLSLIMRRGPTPGAVYDLDADEITIGRGNKNNIVIRDNEVSRDHCRLVRLMGSYEVHDLNSSNGTFVNGQRVVSPWLLQPGTLIELGDTITLEYGFRSPDWGSDEDAQDDIAAEPNAHYSLMMTKGPAVGYIYPLEQNIIAIGRDLSNDIVIQDPEVSRYHLRLQFTRRGYLIEDLVSTNGTFLNGEPLHETRCLEPHDVIKLGTMVQLQYIYREEIIDEDDDSPSRPMPALEMARDETIYNVADIDPGRRELTARSTGLEPGALQDHLMVVYAREDWESVIAPLLVRLQDTHLSAWVDQYLAPGTDEWRVAVEQALGECWLMVIVVSEHSTRSPYVKMMYRAFLGSDKPVIPLLCDGMQTVPGELNRLRTIYYDVNNHQRSFHKLIFEIMQMRQHG